MIKYSTVVCLILKPNHKILVRYLFISVFLIFHVIIQAQVRKNLEASPIKNPPVIDGILSEEIWNNLNPATDFTLIWPETRHGNKIPVEFNTTAYVGYDHNAIYIGAILNHPNPDKMPKQFSQRDDIWNVNIENDVINTVAEPSNEPDYKAKYHQCTENYMKLNQEMIALRAENEALKKTDH